MRFRPAISLLFAWLVICLTVETAGAQAFPAATNWYGQSLRKIHFDMHTPGNVPDIGKNFDADKFALEIKEAGFDAG